MAAISPTAKNKVGTVMRPVMASTGTVMAKATGTRKVKMISSQGG